MTRSALNRLRREGIGAVTTAAIRRFLPPPHDKSFALMQSEVSSARDFDLSISERLWAYRRGFTSKSMVLYDLEDDNYQNYLSDYERRVNSSQINAPYSAILNNKLLTATVLPAFCSDVVRTVGYIGASTHHITDVRQFLSSRWEALGLDGQPTLPDHLDQSSLDQALDEHGTLVAKPVIGASGDDIRVLTADSPQYEALMSAPYPYVVEPYIEQTSYAAKLYPHTANTIRILTMVDEDGPFIAGGFQRFGTSQTGHVDNLASGGLSALIDVEEGTLHKALHFPGNGPPTYHRTHPDTGETFEGTAIPGWEQIIDRIIEKAGSIDHILPYIGWDCIVTDPGEITIIEGNNYPNVRTIQSYEPLLTDGRVCAFYHRHNVLAPRLRGTTPEGCDDGYVNTSP